MIDTRMVTQAVIYCRSAVSYQINNPELDKQENDCREYADMLGVSVIGVFNDDGKVGAPLMRSGFGAMCDFLNTTKIPTVVIMRDIGRISRNMDDMLSGLQLLERVYGTRVLPCC